MLPLKRISFLLLLLFFSCSLFAFNNNSSEPIASKGILNLRQSSLQNPVALSGEWRFEKSFIAPDSTDQLHNFIKVPSLWSGEFASSGFATYSLTILLPNKHSELALEIPDVYSSLKVFVNGNVFFQ